MGAALQVLSYAGFWIGLICGAALSPSTTALVSTPLAKAGVALATTFGLAAIVGAVGRALGVRAWTLLRRVHLGSADAALGVCVGAGSTLVATWLVAGVLLYLPARPLASQIQRSAIVSALDASLPPLPSVVSRLQKLVSASQFPQVFAQVYPQAAPKVGVASEAQLQKAVTEAGASMVKVEGIACGYLQEGSGFVVASHLVVTNAHVVAGVAHPFVVDRSGVKRAATPIFFDPNFDLAVLSVPGLSEPPLRLDASEMPKATRAAVLGYPGGGPFSAVPAGIMADIEPIGRDIYGRGITVRQIYEIQAVVIPGNSGGPLVLPSGEVIGVVFSRSVTEKNVGYALASPGVLSRVHRAESDPVPTSTESCVA